MKHISIATQNSSRLDLNRRLTGQFYTPHDLCVETVRRLERRSFQPRTIADPFCGDGRFILAWLTHASLHSPQSLQLVDRILLWDCDGNAVSQADASVRQLLKRLEINGCQVDSRVLDTFNKFDEQRNSVDLILTNPPWELLKPDSRDLISNDSKQNFIASLKGYSEQLSDSLPGAVSHKRKTMGGATVNLARAGALVCTSLLSANSEMAIVLPASIFADQASAPFRREFFGRLRVKALRYFSAESRIFNGVDQPFVVIVGDGCQATDEYTLAGSGELADSRVVQADLSGEQPVPLLINGAQMAILQGLDRLNTPLKMLELDMRFGLWLGRELDETRIGESFCDDSGIPFLKGRQVDRFSIRNHKPQFIDSRKRQIPPTVSEQRIAWRDVSRPNQKRRMQVACVPQGWVTGNSLGVGYFRYRSRKYLLALLGVFNSLIFELQLRAKLHTPHVSLGVLRECLIPWEIFEDARLLEAIADQVETLLKVPSFELEARLERQIAKVYGLDSEHFKEVLKAFPKLSSLELEVLTAEDI
jgi:Alw26I/Eco31I/Esp3I family type II restriction m6 adenine DNA methyltransferase